MASRADGILQARLVDIFKNDAALIALLADGVDSVFDYIPDDSNFPYLEIGDIVQNSDFGGHDFTGFDFDVEIHVWSRGLGRKEAQQINNRIFELLTDRDLDLSGSFNTMSVRGTFSEITKDPDGITHHGLQRFRILLGGN